MKKKLLALLLLMSVALIAADSSYVQFTGEDFNTFTTYQDWIPAQMITLNVKAGTSVYLSMYTRSWYEDMPNLGDSDYAAGYNMSAGNYGYIYAERDSEGNVRPVGSIHYGNGATKDLTIQNPTGPQTQTLTGYYLDTFDQDAEIFLMMTPNGYDSPVNSYDPVNDPKNDPPYTSILASRQINTVDAAGATRVNFGTTDLVGHEFTIGYEASANPPQPPSGQPLPGVLTSCLVGLAATGLAARRRKQSRK